VNLADLSVVCNFLLLHLQPYQFALERHVTDMMPVWHFNDNRVAGSQLESFGVTEKLLATVFKSDLDNVEGIDRWHFHIRKPVEDVHFITATCATGSVIIASGNFTGFCGST